MQYLFKHIIFVAKSAAIAKKKTFLCQKKNLRIQVLKDFLVFIENLQDFQYFSRNECALPSSL